MNVLASIFMLTLPGAGIVAAGVLVALIGSVLAVQAPPDRRYVLLMAARGAALAAVFLGALQMVSSVWGAMSVSDHWMTMAMLWCALLGVAAGLVVYGIGHAFTR